MDGYDKPRSRHPDDLAPIAFGKARALDAEKGDAEEDDGGAQVSIDARHIVRTRMNQHVRIRMGEVEGEASPFAPREDRRRRDKRTADPAAKEERAAVTGGDRGDAERGIRVDGAVAAPLDPLSRQISALSDETAGFGPYEVGAGLPGDARGIECVIVMGVGHEYGGKPGRRQSGAVESLGDHGGIRRNPGPARHGRATKEAVHHNRGPAVAKQHRARTEILRLERARIVTRRRGVRRRTGLRAVARHRGLGTSEREAEREGGAERSRPPSAPAHSHAAYDPGARARRSTGSSMKLARPGANQMRWVAAR